MRRSHGRAHSEAPGFIRSCANNRPLSSPRHDNGLTDEAALPLAYRKIDARIGGVLWETVLANLPDELGRMLESAVEESRPDMDSIKAAIQREENIPGAELRRGWHLRIK